MEIRYISFLNYNLFTKHFTKISLLNFTKSFTLIQLTIFK